jgi:hypothetical protein
MRVKAEDVSAARIRVYLEVSDDLRRGLRATEIKQDVSAARIRVYLSGSTLKSRMI